MPHNLSLRVFDETAWRHLKTMKVQICMLKAGWLRWISMVPAGAIVVGPKHGHFIEVVIERNPYRRSRLVEVQRWAR
jgi:hypothetical protein